MNKLLLSMAIGAGFLVHAIGHAAAPANAPPGTTGLCNDGTYYSGASKKGACKGHKGVKDWYAAEAAPASKAPAAAAGAAPPPGSTGLCKDGTYYTGTNKKGACKGHKGVKDWYGAPAAAAATPAKSAPPATAAPATPAAAPTAATPAAPATPAAKSPPATGSATQVAAAPGGTAGKVWVNKSTKVYHCPGDRWYGKTREGEYMSEGEATTHGFKPDHGKSCK